MPTPTVEDAIELLTDRQHVVPGQTGARSLVEVRASAIRLLLHQRGADDDTARGLIVQAVDRLGGKVAVEHRRGGLRADGPVMRSQFRVWVPAY